MPELATTPAAVIQRRYRQRQRRREIVVPVALSAGVVEMLIALGLVRDTDQPDQRYRVAVGVAVANLVEEVLTRGGRL